jgi:phosphate transport system substrate-binding protein
MLSLAGSPASVTGETVRINGTGSGLDMMKPLIAAYLKSNPDVSFEMDKPLGSDGAKKALLAGALDIAVSSKPLKPEEVEKGAKIRLFGKTPFVIVTGKHNKLKDISTKELENIFSGSTRQWPGGETIRPVLRPLQDIDTSILRSLSPGMDKAITVAQQRRGMIMAVPDPESNVAVSTTPGSIGASGLTGTLVDNAPLNVLALNGITPSLKALSDGRYPLAKEIHFVTCPGLTPAATRFLDFIYSKKGRAIAAKVGVLVTAVGKAVK